MLEFQTALRYVGVLNKYWISSALHSWTLTIIPIPTFVPGGKEVHVHKELLLCLAVVPCTCFIVTLRNNFTPRFAMLTQLTRRLAETADAAREVSVTCLCLLLVLSGGCNFIPDIKHKPQYHNPFPQISKVAVMPFRNQSQEPTLSGSRVSMAYYNELQSIRGFEVVPFGVVENQLAFFEQQVLGRQVSSPIDFQKFAKHLGVDAVLQGAITDYDPYYPPRMALKVNWYAANPGFHPIPVGYGLPWGTKKEKKIPEWIRLESERALAAEQLKSQTPEEEMDSEDVRPVQNVPEPEAPEQDLVRSDEELSDRVAQAKIELPLRKPDAAPDTASDAADGTNPIAERQAAQEMEISNSESTALPANWPDPQGFIPPRPASQPPEMRVQFEPIISHMRTYNGNDEDFTQALGEYFYFRDDERFGGWQAYLQRSEDFIRFCCHLHIVETLGSRGGELESRMILRWPINRYER